MERGYIKYSLVDKIVDMWYVITMSLRLLKSLLDTRTKERKYKLKEVVFSTRCYSETYLARTGHQGFYVWSSPGEAQRRFTLIRYLHKGF